MYKDMFTRHACSDSNGNFPFASAVNIQVMLLCPLSDGFAEEGFAGVGDVCSGGIVRG